MKIIKIIILVIFFCTISYSQDYKKYLIAYYPFNNSDCKDYSGNNYHGTPVNNPTYINDGVSGKAIHFIGKNDYIIEGQSTSQIGSHVLLPKIDLSKYNDFTISLWARQFDMSYVMGEFYIFFGDHIDGWCGIFQGTYQAPDLAQRNMFAVGGLQWNLNINTLFNMDFLGKWINYTLTYNNGVAKGYIDGKLIGQINQKYKVYGSRVALARHWWDYGDICTSARYTGDLDEVMIFSRELTAEEIKEISKPCQTPTADILSTSNLPCEGDTVILSLSKNFKNIVWSTGENTQKINVTKSGVYSVTFSDTTNCSGNASLNINFLPNPKPKIQTLQVQPCQPDPIILFSAENFSSYLWYDAQTGQNLSNEKSVYITKEGKYFLKIKNNSGCISISDTIEIKFDPSRLKRQLSISFDNSDYEIRFDSVSYSNQFCKNITIRNITNQEISINNPKLMYNLSFSIPQYQLPLLIPANGETKLLICFVPDNLGRLTDSLYLEDSCGIWSIPLVGIGSPNNYNSQTKCDITLTSKTTDIIGGYLNMNYVYIPQKELIRINIQTNNQSSSNLKYSIYNELGQLVKTDILKLSLNSTVSRIVTQELEISTVGLISQLYLLITEYNGKLYNSKFLINK